MKKFKFITILIFSFLVGASILFIANINVREQSVIENVNENYIYFKVKYDITLENPDLLPSKIKNDKEANDYKELLENNNLEYLESLFDIEPNNNLKKNNTVLFYPKEDIEVVRTSRFEVDQDFFTTRGVSETVSKKSVDIFLDPNKTYDECMEELKVTYKGTFNVEFYNKAIPKLIY
ncbi:hypothetical protein [Spiroplasma endosymbiont of Diplazon laetatorius]|uniref:hypothetical protein n=1 Tax=Spiroplasma endosymbiont of Diplazon laetatorius TaxID=3066322 RepID=UPI0030CF7673